MSASSQSVGRRGLLRSGTLITALTGAAAVSTIGSGSAEAVVPDAASEYSPLAAGALGDGIQDDAAALQSLVDNAAAEYLAGTAFTTRQVIIQLPRGRWALGTPLNIKTGVRLRGVGKASTLTALASLGAAPLIIGASGNAVTDAIVEDLALDGGYATTSSAATGIRVTNGARISIFRCHFTNFGNAGVVFQGLNAGGGTPDSCVSNCTFDGIGLADGSTGYGILFKDASSRGVARSNVMRNIKGGMGIGGNGSAATGYPLRCLIADNIITMSAGAMGFEAIGFVAGCEYWNVADNHIYDSCDNGISCSGSYALITGNTIDGTWNHGIAAMGKNSLIIGNLIRNVGKENPAAGYAFISLTSTSRAYIAMNKGFDDQAVPTTTYGVKLNASAGSNVIMGNVWAGNTGSQVIGPVASDATVSYSADGIQTRRVTADFIQAGRVNSTDGVRTKDLGAIDSKTSAQLDAMFLTVPSDGTVAVGTFRLAPVFLYRRGGKWNRTASTLIA